MAVFRIVLWIILAILFGIPMLLLLLSAVPASLSIHYDRLLKVRLRVLGIPFTVFDGSEEPDENHQSKVKKDNEKQTPDDNLIKSKFSALQAALRQEGFKGYVNYFQKIFGYGKKTVFGFRRVFTIRVLKLQYIIAGEEPNEVALRYGQLCGTVYSAQALLEQAVRVRSRKIEIYPNFLAKDSSFTLDAVIRFSPLHLLFTICGGFFRMWGYTSKRITDYESQIDLQGG